MPQLLLPQHPLYSKKQISFSALPILMEKFISALFSLKQLTQQEATWLFAWLYSYPVAHCYHILSGKEEALELLQQYNAKQ